jgi:hypothetical protein
MFTKKNSDCFNQIRFSKIFAKLFPFLYLLFPSNSEIFANFDKGQLLFLLAFYSSPKPTRWPLALPSQEKCCLGRSPPVRRASRLSTLPCDAMGRLQVPSSTPASSPATLTRHLLLSQRRRHSLFPAAPPFSLFLRDPSSPPLQGRPRHAPRLPAAVSSFRPSPSVSNSSILSWPSSFPRTAFASR